jgi:hypothetical protein
MAEAKGLNIIEMYETGNHDDLFNLNYNEDDEDW